MRGDQTSSQDPIDRPSVSEEGEMVERVALGIADELVTAWREEDPTALGFADWPEKERNNIRRLARAALAAAREPTPAMIEAADDANADYRTINLNSHAHLGPEGVFRAMIDEALS